MKRDAFPIPDTWEKDTKESLRDERKRQDSPASFFFSQGQSLVLAARYFQDDRLTKQARDGVAAKHRHKVQLSLFGQLVASFEYLLKDFIAKVIDSTDMLDEKLKKSRWIEVDAGKVLASRTIAATPGAILIHPTMGWHSPEIVNRRYTELFQHQAIESGEQQNLERLWILRHSVAHNAGFVIHHDAMRIGTGALSEKVVNIDEFFLEGTFNFLTPIARRMAEVIGDEKVLLKWLKEAKKSDPDYVRDEITYQKLKKLATYINRRPKDLSDFTEHDYQKDLERIQT